MNCLYCQKEIPVIYQEMAYDSHTPMYTIYRCDDCQATIDYSNQYDCMVVYSFSVGDFTAEFNVQRNKFFLYKNLNLDAPVLELNCLPQNFTPTTFHEKVKTMLTFL